MLNFYCLTLVLVEFYRALHIYTHDNTTATFVNLNYTQCVCFLKTQKNHILSKKASPFMVYSLMAEIELTVDRNFNHFSVPMEKRPRAENWLVQKVTRVKGSTHWQPEPDSQDCAVYTNLTLRSTHLLCQQVIPNRTLPPNTPHQSEPTQHTSPHHTDGLHVPPLGTRTHSRFRACASNCDKFCRVAGLTSTFSPLRTFPGKSSSNLWTEFSEATTTSAYLGEPSKKKNTETLEKEKKFYLTKKKAPC